MLFDVLDEKVAKVLHRITGGSLPWSKFEAPV
jgi:hypothetical protein